MVSVYSVTHCPGLRTENDLNLRRRKSSKENDMVSLRWASFCFFPYRPPGTAGINVSASLHREGLHSSNSVLDPRYQLLTWHPWNCTSKKTSQNSSKSSKKYSDSFQVGTRLWFTANDSSLTNVNWTSFLSFNWKKPCSAAAWSFSLPSFFLYTTPSRARSCRWCLQGKPGN